MSNEYEWRYLSDLKSGDYISYFYTDVKVVSVSRESAKYLISIEEEGKRRTIMFLYDREHLCLKR